jgi:hypothetical protein
MKLELTEDIVCLGPKQLLKVRGGEGHTIFCHSGTVWLTQTRDQRDIVLRAGESFALDRKGQTLVQAFEQSSLSIRPPATAAGGSARYASPGPGGAVLSAGAAA